ncbi:MAG: hypothetical protein QOH47_761 [Sphingomonadales bacterium]|jgi:hypothetical protein|nr:hypothetical protein [Sphingomonadales bacterium]
MATRSVETARGARTGTLLLACVAEHGTATHPHLAGDSLARGHDSARSLADAIHFLSALHGRHPGIVDLAATRTVEPAGRAWLRSAAEAMVDERVYLTRLAVAAGPIPSTPGGTGSETAILAQRAALATLAQSDRRGCALGAALAFAADWLSIRNVLDAAARKLGVDPRHSNLGSADLLREIADSEGPSERALLFGAQQLALQHRALWDLLEARHQARADY